MLIWVNKRKVRKEIKRAWNAFNNHEYAKTFGKEAVRDYLDNCSAFAEAMANITWMFGIHDATPPSDWVDDSTKNEE